jgi:heat shock protein HslJ
MQIVGAQGVLNYSLIPHTRPEEVIPPTAVITAPASAVVNTSITFDASATTSQVPIAQYSWDFGDGGRARGAVVQHVYTQPGEYTVLMTAMDQRDIGNTASHRIVILAPQEPTSVPPTPTATLEPTTEATQAPTPEPTLQPTLEPTAKPPTEPTPPPALPPTASLQGPSSAFIAEPVSFNASGSTAGSSPIASYQWNFGDGSSVQTSTQPTIQYIYPQGGNFQVSVTVNDANGLSSSASQQVKVDSRLDTTVWVLRPTNPGTAITLQFLQGQIAGFAGCNSYSGSYTATDNGDGTFAVAVSGITSTQQACPTDVMNQEQDFLRNLGQVSTARVQGNTLSLGHPGGTLTLYESGTPMPR